MLRLDIKNILLWQLVRIYDSDYPCDTLGSKGGYSSSVTRIATLGSYVGYRVIDVHDYMTKAGRI